MAQTGPVILVGTVGTGVWRSTDGGATWASVRRGLSVESRIYCLATDPSRPARLYVGGADGAFVSEDCGASFVPLGLPRECGEVWRIAVDPIDPETVLAGTRPAALFRSQDGGVTWRRLEAHFPETCPAVGVPRVTAIAIDPESTNAIWAGIEVDGVHRSLDGGKSWVRMDDRMGEIDIHDIIVAPGRRVLVSTPGEVFSTSDAGETWQRLGIQRWLRHPYCRGLSLVPDDANVLLVGTGDAAVGQTGSVARSADGGRTWSLPDLPIVPNSPVWTFATSRADPMLVVACTHYGEVLLSRDAGISWAKLQREFTQVRSLALVVDEATTT